ncbi:MAG: Cfr10I/Bse634I family restriction endonuclease [Blastocatellia bacterium]
MPYTFDPAICEACPFGYCFEDRRNNPVSGRKTKFRVLQRNAISCTFQSIVPGSLRDSSTSLTFDDYLRQFALNVKQAGHKFLGEVFTLEGSALAKVEGDVLEILEGSLLWNAAVTWNRFMASGSWESQVLRCPEHLKPDSLQQIAIVKLPRGYDATQLFSREARLQISELEQRLSKNGQHLKLSAPDFVGVRIPATTVEAVFSTPIENLHTANVATLEQAYRILEGRISAGDLLFALAVKRTMRSDRLYQPLYEANVLKFLVQGILKQPGFRFYAHAVSIEGADVQGHYHAPSIFSLMNGEAPHRAIDRLFVTNIPSELGQAILNELPALT